MPGRRAKSRAIGPWVDLLDLPPPPRKKKKPKQRKRFHPSFRVFLALGLMPSKARQCDPLGLRVNDTMHIMEGECDKSGGLLTGERAPDLLERPEPEPKTVVDTRQPDVAAAQIVDEPEEEHASPPALTNGEHSEPNPEEDIDEVKGTSDSEDGFKPEDDVEKEEIEDEVEENEEKEESDEVDAKEKNEIEESIERLTSGCEQEPALEDDEEKEEDKVDAENESSLLEAQVDSPSDKPSTKTPSPDCLAGGGSREDSQAGGSRDGSLTGGSRPTSPCSRPTSPKRKCPTPKAASSKCPGEATLWAKPPSPALKPSSPAVTSKPSSPLASSKSSPPHAVKEEPVTANELDLRNNIATINITTQNEPLLRKRITEREGEGEISSGSESDTGRKRVKVERDGDSISPNPPQEQQNFMDFERERLIQDFVSDCTQRPEEINRTADKLQKEVETLNELLKAKEMEWNAILRVKKLKEETLERLMRKRRMTAFDETPQERFLDHTTLKNALRSNGSNQLMMVPIVSSSPTSMINRAPPPVRMPDYSRQQRPILPKPYPGVMDPSTVMREGRNGPVLDVKSIIADYRSRHPQDIPRRGRRVRGDPGLRTDPAGMPPRNPSVNPSSLISMSNMALGSGARVRTVNESSYLNPTPEQMRGGADNRGETSGAAGYKDVLAQFAKLTGQPTGLGSGPKTTAAGAAPPPYPEVTLHPVGGIRPPSPPSSSLLHGILTKSAPSSRPSNFSPTLARLLTAPDRPAHQIPPPPYRPQQNPRVSISDIINSSKKSRNEITITPVPGNQPQKPPKEEVIMADEDDGESGDRLVIDESAEESPLQCQGCKQKMAQFVCAGCGNQWYCSRECQVTAWEEHSDICSG